MQTRLHGYEPWQDAGGNPTTPRHQVRSLGGGEPDPFGGVERKKVHLPPWIESVLNSNGAAAYKLNTTMGCLDRQREWLLSTRAWGTYGWCT